MVRHYLEAPGKFYSYESTDWRKILALYDLLVEIDESPVVALSRAVAIAKVHGPSAGWRAVAEIENKKPISSYYLLHAVLADFNLELGNLQDASDHLLKALELTHVEIGTRIPDKEAETLRGREGLAQFAAAISFISKLAKLWTVCALRTNAA